MSCASRSLDLPSVELAAGRGPRQPDANGKPVGRFRWLRGPALTENDPRHLRGRRHLMTMPAHLIRAVVPVTSRNGPGNLLAIWGSDWERQSSHRTEAHHRVLRAGFKYLITRSRRPVPGEQWANSDRFFRLTEVGANGNHLPVMRSWPSGSVRDRCTVFMQSHRRTGVPPTGLTREEALWT